MGWDHIVMSRYRCVIQKEGKQATEDVDGLGNEEKVFTELIKTACGSVVSSPS